MSGVRVPMRIRFWRLAAPAVGAPHECWVWPGAYASGYGVLGGGGEGASPVGAHRVSYELNVAPIPAGHDIHHTCENTRCVNPAHLEPKRRGPHLRGHLSTLPGQNAAKTHCIRGHEFTPANTYITRLGARGCRACGAASARRRRRDA